MSVEKAVDILKGAILLERRGKAFYESVVRNTSNESVKTIFKTMAGEEEKHIHILEQHFSNLKKNGKFKSLTLEGSPSDVIAEEVLNRDIKQNISASSYEAAAISAAMSMEEKAVNYYSARGKETSDALEKELYNWLSTWEKTHLQLLADIDDELKENIWFDNNFWPVD